MKTSVETTVAMIHPQRGGGQHLPVRDPARGHPAGAGITHGGPVSGAAVAHAPPIHPGRSLAPRGRCPPTLSGSG